MRETKKEKVIIIGGGIAALTANRSSAWALRKSWALMLPDIVPG